MKRIILTIAIILLGLEFSNAQKKTDCDSKLIGQLIEVCDLTPAQIAKVKPIVINFERKRDDTYQKYHLDPAILNKEVRKNRWNYEVSLIGILTPEQMGVLKAFDQQNPPIMTGGVQSNYKPVYFVRAK